MPLNYLEIQKQVEEFGTYAANRQQDTQDVVSHLQHVLEINRDQHEAIHARINLTREHHASLRCAAPGTDLLDQVYDPPGENRPAITVLASDGSQIFPDNHGVTTYGVINTGIVSINSHTDEIPEVTTETRLFYPGVPPFDQMDLNEDMISFLRDIEERSLLCEKLVVEQSNHAPDAKGELPFWVALTDGPLDLFAKPGSNRMQTRKLFDGYLMALLTVQQSGGLIAGYIERPRASMLVRTLEIMDTAEEALTRKGRLDRQYPGITDVMLFSGLLLPGQRTGVFRLLSNNESNYSNRDPQLGLHFFYLNVGYYLRNGQPFNVFARVEIPAWVAYHKAQVDLLHQVLIEQSRILGTTPYPYVLHRAHETAIVRFVEKEDLDRMIASQFLAKGLLKGQSTQKSANKRLSGS